VPFVQFKERRDLRHVGMPAEYPRHDCVNAAVRAVIEEGDTHRVEARRRLLPLGTGLSRGEPSKGRFSIANLENDALQLGEGRRATTGDESGDEMVVGHADASFWRRIIASFADIALRLIQRVP
jgi:hypothetical protein